ncbi:MAG: phospholipase [Bacteroidales bacterium]|nr:phospholipase [Bacteroidales bacterium]
MKSMVQSPVRRFLAVLALLLIVSGQGSARRFISHTGVVEGSYDFWYYSPSDTLDAESNNLPTVIFLHGRSLCGNNLQMLFKYGTLDALERGLELEANVIAPQNPDGPWNPEKLLNLLDWCLTEYGGDSSRVYVMGMSLGGFGTMDFCGTYPDRLAAGISLCGGTSLKDFSSLSELPLWIIHGTADKSVPLKDSKKVVDDMLVRRKNGRLLYDWLSGFSHGILARAFYLPVFYDWLFSHSLAEKGRPMHPGAGISNADFENVYDKLTPGDPIPREKYKKH